MNTNLGTLRTQRFHRLATLAAALFLTLPLAACGGGDDTLGLEPPTAAKPIACKAKTNKKVNTSNRFMVS